ncbi:hypothetical protein TcWFU_000346 [Taenia crassiceps]|uniref:Secreted protein n=1 Tax=Taenia crassiceps TaxID=6207 RepID=A0ABR4Q3J9_9CEST
MFGMVVVVVVAVKVLLRRVTVQVESPTHTLCQYLRWRVAMSSLFSLSLPLSLSLSVVPPVPSSGSAQRALNGEENTRGPDCGSRGVGCLLDTEGRYCRDWTAGRVEVGHGFPSGAAFHLSSSWSVGVDEALKQTKAGPWWTNCKSVGDWFFVIVCSAVTYQREDEVPRN